MKDKKYSEFTFMFNNPLELHYALIATSLKEELLEQIGENNLNVVKKPLETLEQMTSKLSSYMKWELNYFFHIYVNSCNGMGQSIFMGYFSDNLMVDNIEEFIRIIEKSDESTMFSYVVERVFYENKNKNIREMYSWDEIKVDLNKMLDVIKQLEFYHENMKEKLIESLENAKETKQRYCMLLKQFYEKIYKPLETEIYELLAPCIKQYEDEFKRSPEKFSRKYFAKDVNVFAAKVNIHISYFKGVGSDYWASSKEELEWIILGADTYKLSHEEPQKERVLEFLKAISDKRRMTIIELLAEKSWYVNEIAEKIGMSAATTSYHLTNLQELGIVDFERYDHRFYYYLNKDKLRELFNLAMKTYLHE